MPDNDTVLIPNTGTGEDDVSESIDKVLDQAFADNHTARMHAGRRMTEAADNIAEQTRLGFLEEKMKVGTREAAAMQRMDADKVAQALLQQNAVRDQPGQNTSGG